MRMSMMQRLVPGGSCHRVRRVPGSSNYSLVFPWKGHQPEANHREKYIVTLHEAGVYGTTYRVCIRKKDICHSRHTYNTGKKKKSHDSLVNC